MIPKNLKLTMLRFYATHCCEKKCKHADSSGMDFLCNSPKKSKIGYSVGYIDKQLASACLKESWIEPKKSKKEVK